MPKVTPEPQTEARHWHPYYRDPTGDVILCSNDQVHFRTSIYRLSEASTVFAGMFEAARHNGEDRSNEVIDIPFTSQTVEYFLGWITVPNPSHLQLKVASAGQLMEMAVFYDCKKARTLAAATFRDASASEPLKALLYASAHNDVPLARQSIKLVTPSITCGEVPFAASGGFWELINALRPEWRLPLLQLIIVDDGKGKKKKAPKVMARPLIGKPTTVPAAGVEEPVGRMSVMDDWSAVGNRFAP